MQTAMVVLVLAGLLVAVWLLITGTRGRCRVAGIVGTVLLLLSLLSGVAYRRFLDPHLGRMSDAELITILAGQTVLESVLTSAGLLLLTYAIIIANRLPRS
ncbi:hypothetical protein [Microlunatus sp. Gsoil 973]|uniref:hypothetical protein n=1 Tax=Microlunatus sp. Gsoil 973 TaxID=2672569 RepID=UPI0012B4445F|nr:hypothetical protein [Microlunatus sp. Gsoil 973]QGN32659.1 hypothetical protein GJV80_07380 [Microlunatus sp. Gsoil 973]